MWRDWLVKKVYKSEVRGNRVRGRHSASWEGWVREYIEKRTLKDVKGMEHAKEVCLDRAGGRLFCHGPTPQRRVPRGNKASEM